MTFKCLTPYNSTDVAIGFLLLPQGVDRQSVIDGGPLPGGEAEQNITFLAKAEANQTTVLCRVNEVTQPGNSDTADALLLIQGGWFTE